MFSQIVHGLGGALEGEHLQRAVHLVQIGSERLEALALRRIARERVEHLLDVLQVGGDLARHLGAQLKRAHLVQEVAAQARGRLAVRLALRRVEHPAAEDHDLPGQVRRRAAEVVDDGLDQQEGRGHLDHHVLLVARIRVGQVLGDERDRVEQLDEMLVSELPRLGLEGGEKIAKARRAFLLARDVVHPGGLQRFQARMQVVERGLEPLGIELRCPGAPSSAGGAGNRLSSW